VEPPGTRTQPQEEAPAPGLGIPKHGQIAPRALRGINVRIFSSASDAPRARRPTDVLLLIVAIVGLLVLSIQHRDRPRWTRP